MVDWKRAIGGQVRRKRKHQNKQTSDEIHALAVLLEDIQNGEGYIVVSMKLNTNLDYVVVKGKCFQRAGELLLRWKHNNESVGEIWNAARLSLLALYIAKKAMFLALMTVVRTLGLVELAAPARKRS